MKEYLEQRIELYRVAIASELPKPLQTAFKFIITELTAALNHLNKIENEKS